MKELIEVKVNESLGVNAVSARDLYLGLGLDASNWAKWAKLNIENNDYFAANVDYMQFVLSTSAQAPNPVASRVGAWIETIDALMYLKLSGRVPCGRVD